MARPFSNKRKLRLSFGFLCLLLGCFLTLSVVSYFFSWQSDQDSLLSAKTLGFFLFEDTTIVNNWGGRLGAAAAHALVYQGMGIFSVLLTIWVGLAGLNLLNGRPVVPIARWGRWIALGFLFFCPLFAFLFATHPFPFGGALGNGLVFWTNGFAGKAGTILMLTGVFCFFAFIVFQWDIKPLLSKARKILPSPFPAAGTGIEERTFEEATSTHISSDTMPPVAAPAFSTADDTEDEDGIVPVSNGPLNANKLKGGEPALVALEDDEDPSEDMAFTVIDKTTDVSPGSEPSLAVEPAGGDRIPLDRQENRQEGDAEVEASPEGGPEPALDFEVRTVKEDQAIPAHNSHISIESMEPYDPSLDLPRFKFPTLDLLDRHDQQDIQFNREELEKNKNQIISTLKSFGIQISRISATVGPTVTLYEIIPAEGVRISKIKNLEDDIALSLSALGIRIIAPIPGRGTIGVEVPNTQKQVVSMFTLLSSEKFANAKMSLPIALGKKIDNENYIVDLASMPHLLVAGATGQGKSVGINAILVSLLYKKHPSQLKFVMVDPKIVELSIYRTIEKHYLAKLPDEEEAIITDTKKVINTLNALCIEMDNRYELLKDAGSRNIKEYNEKFIKRRLNPNLGHKYLPFIVLVIDEFADLIMTAGKEIEMPIARLAQKARAVGIHIIIATQRPSVNVITGVIKANFPARIAFKVSSKIDSRTILDTGGADQLIGRGDMLISHGSEILRLQCAFVDTPEVERIVEFIGAQDGYPSAFELPEYEGAEEDKQREQVDLSRRDKMFEECARMVVNSQSGSTSMLQRKFNLGYNRAGRIMDQLEAAGIVGPASGSKPRDVMIDTEASLEHILQGL